MEEHIQRFTLPSFH